MAAGVYSVRFFSVFGPYNLDYYVPDGKRAVVRSINMVNTSSAEAQVLLYAVTAYIYFRILPGSSAVTPVDMRVTLYAGERLAISTFGPEPSVSVNGFLFADTGGRADDPQAETLPSLDAAPWPPPGPLPWD